MVFATQLKELYLDKTTPTHLDGKAKTIYVATQGQRTKPPGRYSAFGAHDLPKVDLEERTITLIQFFQKYFGKHYGFCKPI